ncbi:GNAT family N-acetyltransferase [Comamonas terrae]|uniref:GNAT family N-acetyltransferase n=1 Tax=Comamonas terrae TaxID=673548 RepID=A0ABW5ULU6_9BURK|nr:GNAT family N-acetyltransferase [Comamonas terrae]
MHIRRLQAADLADYRTLRRQALLESPSAFSATPQTEQAVTDAQLLARFDSTPGQAMWGAWDGGRLCSTLGMYREQNAKLAHKATLFAMYVAPGACGRGIAGRLLQAAIEHGRSLGLRWLQLGVNADNGAALRLYENAGFAACGRMPEAIAVDGRFHDEILMALRLAPSAG